ncbi:zinc finger MYND domain-containing protein 10 isoform X2 [Prorops nasuta]|uniref:zinc finger MYND domain-containing protein 10 isoform X2 n=1 Tax=Prorops nasuta TaxID=863751 RepID=UPI0034CD2EAD
MNGKQIVSSWEAEAYIQDLKIYELEDVGSESWLEFHKRLILLNQQSVVEISNLQEENIKEWFVTLRKIPILIYEAIQIDVWKHKVFPILIEINEELKNTFLLFSVFYHENIAISLLENVLFHSDSVETMDDTVLDLIDYAVKYIISILDIKNVEIHERSNYPKSSCMDEILEKKKELEFDIGIRCISILRYLIEFSDNLSICVLSRMLTTHDVPYLFIQLIEIQPWKRTNENGDKMIYNAKWEKLKSDEEDTVPKIEGQVWFGLRELLLNPNNASYYEITEFRLNELMKKYLHETVLDQIAPLIDLKRWLSFLSVSSSRTISQTINVEIIPQIRSSIYDKYHKKWKKLAKIQSTHIFTKDVASIASAARILSDAYDLDKIDCIERKKCFLCEEPAKNRCSKCKEAWYCGRECQVLDWDCHKDICVKIMQTVGKESEVKT